MMCDIQTHLTQNAIHLSLDWLLFTIQFVIARVEMCNEIIDPLLTVKRHWLFSLEFFTIYFLLIQLMVFVCK